MRQQQQQVRDIPSYPYSGRFPQEKIQQHTHAIAHAVTAYQRGYYIIVPCILFVVSLVLLCVMEWNGAGTLTNALALFFSVISVIASSVALMFGIARAVK